MAGQFTGKVAIVTGGTSGLGLASAEAFAKEGAKVVICARGKEAGEKAEKKLRDKGHDVTYVQCDVSKAAEVEAMVKKTVELYGRLDFAFNNAGIPGDMTLPLIEDYPEEVWEAVDDVNVKGMFLCMKYEIPEMLKVGGGAIVNCSSICGAEYLIAGCFPYNVTKAAALTLSKAIAVENGTRNIRVNAVQPGLIDAGVTAMALDSSQEWKDHMEICIDRTPMKRLGEPSEVGDAVVFLCSDKASFITGSTLIIDGGYTLGAGITAL